MKQEEAELKWLTNLVEKARTDGRSFPRFSPELLRQQNFRSMLINILMEDPNRYLTMVKMFPEFAGNDDARTIAEKHLLSEESAATMIESMQRYQQHHGIPNNSLSLEEEDVGLRAA